ncbi:hypothetical protein [Brucella sp.]|uniref:hypothetical protein n=1 Tax=Brucella sp. TaxID=52132 RepID=UPI0028B1BB08|nr:hypothetical protein [Brucella sp.]
MIILGLDQAQNCGFAIYDTNAPLSAIRVGVIRAKEEKSDKYEDMSARLGLELMKLLKVERPDFVALEQPIRTMPGGGGKVKAKVKFMGEEQVVEKAVGGGMNAVISSNQMTGAAAAIVGAFRIPFMTIAPVTWRKTFLGFGTRPGWERDDWKGATRARCTALKIKVTNNDQSDAVGVAVGASSSQIVKAMMMGVLR